LQLRSAPLKYRKLPLYQMDDHLEIFIKWVAWAEGHFAINEEYFARGEQDFFSIEGKQGSSFQRLEGNFEARMRVRRHCQSGGKA
jgi:hypothetical protein